MSEKIFNSKWTDYLLLVIGSIMYMFVSWHWNMPIAAWISPIFLIRFFRNQKKFSKTLIALPFLSIASYLKMVNGWDVELYLAILIAIFLPILLMLLPLYLDRYFSKKLPSNLATLIFPCAILLVEYLIYLTPLGTGFSLGATQFKHTAFLQTSSITGMWGLSFIIAWTASVINTIWEQDFNIKKPSNLTKVYSVVIITIFAFGAFRLAISESNSETVKVGSITVTHEKDYWSEIVDKKTPVDEASIFQDELMQMEDKLFNLSLQAVEGGAKIVFWSEANAIYYEDQEEVFLNRSKAFAKENQIYFAPAVLKLYYNSYISDNMIYMITPEGDFAFDYIKTISWYETTSDGVIDYVDTPYGRIASAICFDNDFPNFIRQAGKNKVDIFLVPSYDTETIKDYHTRSTLIRGVENGMSVIRQSNKGVSMGIDYYGNVLSYQDYFDTQERLMYTDLPTKGVQTIYAIFGDWVIYADLALSLGFLVWYMISMRKKKTNI